MHTRHTRTSRFRILLSVILVSSHFGTLVIAVGEDSPRNPFEALLDLDMACDSLSTTGGRGLEYRHPQVPLDADNYTVAPAPLELEQVHVFVRHGKRL